MEKYDSREDTEKHIANVGKYLNKACGMLTMRAIEHDASKLLPPEKECFDEITPLLKVSTYGSEEYKATMAGVNSRKWDEIITGMQEELLD